MKRPDAAEFGADLDRQRASFFKNKTVLMTRVGRQPGDHRRSAEAGRRAYCCHRRTHAAHLWRIGDRRGFPSAAAGLRKKQETGIFTPVHKTTSDGVGSQIETDRCDWSLGRLRFARWPSRHHPSPLQSRTVRVRVPWLENSKFGLTGRTDLQINLLTACLQRQSIRTSILLSFFAALANRRSKVTMAAHPSAFAR